jgi:hypothetical protein
MAEENSGYEMIKAKRVNLLNIVVYDLRTNKRYKAKCVCGHMFYIDILISGSFLEERKKAISQHVIKENTGCYSLSGTINKTLGIHFDRPYVNVSWACAKCTDTIDLHVTRFF